MKRYSIVLIVAVAALANADDKPGARNMSEMKFGNVPALPTCTTVAVQSGDPTATQFVAAMKANTGCTIPWHWHSASENLVIVSGTVRLGMREDNGTATVKSLTAGAYVSLPPKHVHEFRCEKTCQVYLSSDAKFDIHYVDPKGTEIQPEEALRGVKETAATAMR
jgi:quercetin dioxygenase-like cupin family protein